MSQSPLRRAAILINSLPPEAAARVLATMSPEQRQRVRTESRRLGPVDENERKRIIASFLRSTPKSPTTAKTESPTPAPRNETETRDTGFEFLHEVNDDVLHRALLNEPAAAIAVVLAHLPPAQAAKLLQRLSEEQRDQVIVRLSRMDEVAPDALTDLGEHLRGLVHETSRRSHAIGRRALAAMASHLEGPMLQAVARAAPDLPLAPSVPSETLTDPDASDRFNPALGLLNASRATVPPATAAGEDSSEPTLLPFPSRSAPSARRWAFSDLQKLPPTTLRRLLAEVESETAVLALLGMRVDVAEAVLATLPRRQAKQVRREIAALGPLLLRDIDQAQGELERAAERLLEQGSIPMPERFAAVA